MHQDTVFLYRLAMLFGALAIAYLIFLYCYKNYIIKKGDVRKVIQSNFSDLLGELLLFDKKKASKKELSDLHQKKMGLRESIAIKRNREVLVALMLKMGRDLTGDAQETLIDLYKELNLHLYAVQQLKNYRWEKVAAAILELTQMQVSEAYIPIRAFLKDRRKVVRKQAEIAVISLKEEGIAYFLGTVDQPLSEWQQLKIIETLKGKPSFDLPAFKNWFSNNNTDVVLLAMRLALAFDQRNLGKELGTLLSHKSPVVKEEALGMITKQKISRTKPDIIAMYWKSSEDFKLKALFAIQAFPDRKDLPFIEEVLQREQSDRLLSKAMKIMELIAPEETQKQWNAIEGALAEQANLVSEVMPAKDKSKSIKNLQAQDNSTPVSSLSVLSNFFEQDNFNKVLLLDAARKLMDFKDLPYLKKIVELEGNLAIKIKALELVQEMGGKRLQSRPVLSEYKDLFS